MSGKGSQETIARLTEHMVTSLTTKTIDSNSPANEPYLLVLVSTTSGSRKQLSQQERSIAMLEALEIPFATLNGAMPEYRVRRDRLFAMSGIRGNYPQFFKISTTTTEEDNDNNNDNDNEDKDQSVEFVGNYDVIETINENSNVNANELRDKDLTWDRLMGTCQKYDKKAKQVNIDLGADSAHSTGSGGGIYGALDSDDDDDNSSRGGGNNIYAELEDD